MFAPSSGSVAAAPAVAPVAEPEPVKEEKKIFNVVLQKFDAASKAKIIREVKLILPQLSLVEAKTLVESAPKPLKEGVKKEDAEKMKKTLEDLGATVLLE